ncbi:MAG: crossover junction endodeoxyribonuclease RuvC [Clostridia bacterium]|nr:crossover junction endodeoxyribonuclease RuvC [Clostridia bacterium]
MLVLGIDPGYAIVGYGVLKYDRNRFMPVEYGAVTTKAKTEFTHRLETIYEGICDIIDRTHPEAMSIEKLFFNTNTKTAIDVAQARGVILLAAKKKNVPIFEYTPLQVKQAVTGYGKAPKAQVMDLTRRLLNLESVPKPDDTADALALAICHCHSARSLIFKNMQGGIR